MAVVADSVVADSVVAASAPSRILLRKNQAGQRHRPSGHAQAVAVAAGVAAGVAASAPSRILVRKNHAGASKCRTLARHRRVTTIRSLQVTTLYRVIDVHLGYT